MPWDFPQTFLDKPHPDTHTEAYQRGTASQDSVRMSELGTLQAFPDLTFCLSLCLFSCKYKDMDTQDTHNTAHLFFFNWQPKNMCMNIKHI